MEEGFQSGERFPSGEELQRRGEQVSYHYKVIIENLFNITKPKRTKNKTNPNTGWEREPEVSGVGITTISAFGS